MKAFVTGATGFIGLNLVGRLVQEGWRVTALHRASSELTYLQRFNAKLVEGSITDKQSLFNGVPKNTDVIFHLAGSTNMWSKHNKVQTKINIEGTKNLVEVTKAKGIKTFIHVSSIAAWGNAVGHINETTPQQGQASWINYEKSKWAGEQIALNAATDFLKVISLNPVVVTGPYDTTNWGRMLPLLRDKAVPAMPSGQVNITHVSSVVDALLNAVTTKKNRERYILSGEHTTYAAFISEMARLVGAEPPTQLPASLIKSFAWLSTRAAVLGNKTPDTTPELVAMMTRENVDFSSQKAIQELNYKVLPWQEGVKDCYDWFVRENLL